MSVAKPPNCGNCWQSPLAAPPLAETKFLFNVNSCAFHIVDKPTFVFIFPVEAFTLTCLLASIAVSVARLWLGPATVAVSGR